MAEQSHYKSIRVRELRLRRMPTTNLRRPPAHWRVEKRRRWSPAAPSISVDYFKRFLAQLRGFIGGRVRSYESLLDRARREAVLRMKEEAAQERLRRRDQRAPRVDQHRRAAAQRPRHRRRRGARLRHGAQADRASR